MAGIILLFSATDDISSSLFNQIRFYLIWLSRGEVTTKGCLPQKVVFHQRSSSTKGHLPPKVIFHQRSSSSKVVFQWRLSSTVTCLSLKVVFHWRLFSTESRLPQKVIFHWRSSSTEGRLPPNVAFYRWLSSTYLNTLVDLIFARTVNIPNFSLLPCLEVAWYMMHDVTP